MPQILGLAPRACRHTQFCICGGCVVRRASQSALALRSEREGEWCLSTWRAKRAAGGEKRAGGCVDERTGGRRSWRLLEKRRDDAETRRGIMGLAPSAPRASRGAIGDLRALMHMSFLRPLLIASSCRSHCTTVMTTAAPGMQLCFTSCLLFSPPLRLASGACMSEAIYDSSRLSLVLPVIASGAGVCHCAEPETSLRIPGVYFDAGPACFSVNAARISARAQAVSALALHQFSC